MFSKIWSKLINAGKIVPFRHSGKSQCEYKILAPNYSWSGFSTSKCVASWVYRSPLLAWSHSSGRQRSGSFPNQTPNSCPWKRETKRPIRKGFLLSSFAMLGKRQHFTPAVRMQWDGLVILKFKVETLTIDEHWHEVSSWQRQGAGEDQHPHLRHNTQRHRASRGVTSGCVCTALIYAQMIPLCAFAFHI